EEDRSIVGWNVEDIDKIQLKFHQAVKTNEDKIKSLCVSDDKKLAYITSSKQHIIAIVEYIVDKEFTNFTTNYAVIDMNNKDKKNALSFNKYAYANYCTFNLKGEFILYSSVKIDHEIIWIYSTQTKNNKWKCKRFYRIPKDYELISISKYDK
ncbi:hypothetical protein RhiirA1_474635, partial [Rhizophagus irregularis]